MRGRIDHRACLVRQRIDSLMRRVRALARSPAALPVAFVGGLMVGRLRVPDFKRAYALLTRLVGPAKTLLMASRLIGSPAR